MALLQQTAGSDLLKGFLKVGVPTIVDVLDSDFALRNAMSSDIIGLIRKRIAGRAVTVKWTAGAKPLGPLDPLFSAIDGVGSGQVLVISNAADKSMSCMGDLVALALHVRGAEGAIMDGPVRDIEPILALDFPIFSAGRCPVNPTGKASVDSGIPIVCGGVPVTPGDIIVADWDGVVVVPQGIASDVLSKAVAFEKMEEGMRERIRTDVRSTRLADIFAAFEPKQDEGSSSRADR